jgi:hypothetical protein
LAKHRIEDKLEALKKRNAKNILTPTSSRTTPMDTKTAGKQRDSRLRIPGYLNNKG